ARAEALKAKMVTYGEQLKTAGDGSTLFATAQAGVDEVYAALFYIELKVKDRKLGAPAGLTLDCPASACPELLESPLSKTSKDHVLVNLHALKEVYEGVDGAPGFDDFLAAADAQELSAEIVGEIDAAIAGVEAYAGTFEEHVVADPAKVAALYELVKTFADDFKADLASTLAVRVPAEGAGDND
ncbi:MAG TPA: imelysin family protein, partial [Myxococcota bacterium]